MRTLVPFDARDPNSRLAPVLDTPERREFADAMLRDVVDAVRAAGGSPTILATAEYPGANEPPAPLVVDDRPLTTAVEAAIDGDTAVVMSDLPLADADSLRRAFDAPAPGEVAAAPGLGGGTNVLVVRHADFTPDYHGTSFEDHRAAAAAVDAPFRAVDSFRLAVDVDGPEDLIEVFLHNDGRAADWLHDHGFHVTMSGGRASLTRDPKD